MNEQVERDFLYMEGFEHRTLASLKVEAGILASALNKVHLTWMPWPESQEGGIKRLRAMLNMVNGAIEERTLWPYKVRYVAFGSQYSLRCGNLNAAMSTVQQLEDDPIASWPCVLVCCPTHGWQYASVHMGAPVLGSCRVCGYVPD